MKNNLRKKLLTGVLSLALAFSMTACGSGHRKHCGSRRVTDRTGYRG